MSSYTIESIKLIKFYFVLLEENTGGEFSGKINANFSFDIDHDNTKLKLHSNLSIEEEHLPIKLESKYTAVLSFKCFPDIDTLSKIIYDDTPALLIPYQREIISSTTLKSFDTPILLPNLSRDYAQKHQDKYLSSIKEKLDQIFQNKTQ